MPAETKPNRLQLHRLGRRFVAWGATGLAVVGIVVFLGPLGTWERLPPAPAEEEASPPPRTLELSRATLLRQDDSVRLSVEGTTDLVAGTQLEISVWAEDERLLRFPATVPEEEQFAVTRDADGTVVEGAYEVRVSFRLEAQPSAIREALEYRPRRLSATRPLNVLHGVAGQAPAKGELAKLFERLNRAPHDPATLDELDAKAQELSRKIWLGKEKAALRKLRLAIEEARKPDSRSSFERLLLEAHVLADL